MMLRTTAHLLIALVVACASDQPPKAPARAPAATTQIVAAPALDRIDDPSLVCMVNDMYMGRPQIPVAVDGATYFGCCSACQARLTSDASIRMATDPVSGAPVDKATAVLARDGKGKILYFASEETFSRYRLTTSSSPR